MTTPAYRRAQIRAATLAAHTEMNRLDAETREQLRELYLNALHDIEGRLDILPADNPVQLHQLQSIRDDVNERLGELHRARDAQLDDGIQQAATLGAQPIATGAAVNRISAAAVQHVRAFRAADGLQLSDRLWRLNLGASETVQSVIEQAVIQGWDADDAARRLLGMGRTIPAELREQINAAKPGAIAKKIAQELVYKTNSAMDYAHRVMRTEINRAHGEAYIAGAFENPDAIGMRFLLSPAHPKPDVCDLHATANLYGLGRGVYPSRVTCPWPAHPNTLSFVVVVFADEVTAADRAGRETLDQALTRISPAAADNLPTALRQRRRELVPRPAPAPRPRPQPAQRPAPPPAKAPKPAPPKKTRPPVTVDPVTGRDSVSASYFNGHVNVDINGELNLDGIPLSHSDIAGMIGAIDGSEIGVQISDNVVEFRAIHPFLQRAQERALYVQPSGELVMKNEYFMLKKDYQSTGLGLRSFAYEAMNAARLGIAKIETYAAGEFGSPVFNGYYTWPRMGYDAPLNHRDVSRLPGNLSHARTIQDLMASKEGRDWWKRNGSGRPMVFDLKAGSRSQSVLAQYLKERGVHL